MSDLSQARAVIVVFAMDGCPACEDYKPRFEQMVKGFQAHGCPLVIYRRQALMPGQIPVLIIDAASTDPSVVGFADQHQIQALPSTLLLTRSHGSRKLEGALDDAQIYEVLASAVQAR